MKRIIKVFSSLLLIALLAVTMVMPAFAADAASVTYYGHEKGFGFEPGSAYTDSDLFSEAFKGVMPGDVVTETITVTNESTDSDYIKLYMQAKAHGTANPMSPNVAAEEASAAEMNDFLAQLEMKVWNGDRLIYQASPDKTAGLTNPVLLGQFDTGEGTTLKVELIVPLTLGNEYADRVGEVDWLFTAEQGDHPHMNFTVTKVWTDKEADHPDQITVTLFKDGDPYAHKYLNEENGWTYTWTNLPDGGYNWYALEVVPKGYTVEYEHSKYETVMYNTASLIQTGQLNWPVPVLVAAGVLLMTAGLILIRKDRKEEHD